jgi:isochorismate hydrolase
MVHSEPYITPQTLEARADAWHTELARAGIGRNPYRAAPGRTALLVIDMQRYFLREGSHAFLPAGRCVRSNVLRLIDAWRSAGAPVILTRHAVAQGEDPGAMARWWQDTVREGTEDALLDAKIAASAAGAPVLRKTRYSAFHGTGLQESLRELGVERVVISGVMTHLCVESTAREAFIRDFEVLLATDASASASEELHLGSLRALGHGFAFLARTEKLIDLLKTGRTDD